MTAETFIHQVVTWVLDADSKEECVKRFEAVMTNPKLVAFIKEYRARQLIFEEIMARAKERENENE